MIIKDLTDQISIFYLTYYKKNKSENEILYRILKMLKELKTSE
jgi:hypothetical protein